MSKSNLLKEVLELKSLVRPRITLRRVILVGVVSVLAFLYGRDGLSYLSTAGSLISQKVQARIPMEFELERARNMIENLIPTIKRNFMVIAEEEAEVERAKTDLDTAQRKLDLQREQLVAFRAKLDTTSPSDTRFVSTGRDGDLHELAHKFEILQISEDTVRAKQRVLNAREKSLQAAVASCEKTLNARRDLEVKVENIKARLRQMQTTNVAKSVDLDTTSVAKIENLLNGLDMKLQVAERLAQTEGKYDALIETYSSPSVDNIEERVDDYLAQHSHVEQLADAR